jgi:hypothetical protein
MVIKNHLNSNIILLIADNSFAILKKDINFFNKDYGRDLETFTI